MARLQKQNRKPHPKIKLSHSSRKERESKDGNEEDQTV